jgi:aminopeptidase 2
MPRKVLSPGVKPTHYDLLIEPDLEAGTFEGTVAIKLDVTPTMASIILNVHQLEIRTTEVQDAEGNSVSISGTTSDEALQTFTVSLGNPATANVQLILRLAFAGVLDTTGFGFHRTKVASDSNYMASTLMEPIYARTVFPCFDQPDLKATFSVTIVAERFQTCLGNMPIKSETEVPSRSTVKKLVGFERTPIMTSYLVSTVKKVVEFERTPIMSTYLVAFAVGEFNMIETHQDRIHIRAFAPVEYDIEHCRFALDVAARALRIHEKTFQIDYALPKLDLLAIPGATGGMENWGLTTLPACIQLISPDNTAEDKARSSEMIVHELAHQWFGNLVTMSSWDCFWLKEALSDWAQLHARERMLESWEPLQDFVADGYQLGLLSDSTKFSHPLEIPFDGIKISSVFFDEITYKKGCAILRIISNHLGEETFLEGIRHFLKRYTFGNAKPGDFWEVIKDVSGISVASMMDVWTKNAGYPVISVVEDEKSGTISITQNRFLIDPESAGGSDILFPMFLNIQTNYGIIKETLKERSKTIKISLDFYKLNVDQTGFFRVAYSPTRLAKLGGDVGRGTISAEDRIGLVSDTAALVFTGNLNIRTSNFLSLVQNFEEEPSFFVWKIIIAALGEMSKYVMFEEDSFKIALGRFQKHLVKKCLYRNGTFTDMDEINDQRFKALLFGNSGGDENVIDAALIMFVRFIKGDKKAVNPNIRADVFRIALEKGSSKAVRFPVHVRQTALN